MLKITKMRIRKPAVIGWNELKLNFEAAESAEFIHISQYEPPPPQRRRRRRGRLTQYDTVDLLDDNSEAPPQPPVPIESPPPKASYSRGREEAASHIHSGEGSYYIS